MRRVLGFVLMVASVFSFVSIAIILSESSVISEILLIPMGICLITTFFIGVINAFGRKDTRENASDLVFGKAPRKGKYDIEM